MTENEQWAAPKEAEQSDAPPAGSPPSGAAEPPGHPSASAPQGGGNGAIMPILGLMIMVLAGLVAGLVAFIQRDEAQSFPSSRGDDDYVLGDMTLRVRDVPAGMGLRAAQPFDNTEWAGAKAEDGEDEVEVGRLQKQLDSAGRIRNFVSLFGWTTASSARFGEGLRLTAQSTLYDSEESARKSVTGQELCGLLLNSEDPIEEFAVPRIGDESTGFSITTIDDSVGRSVDTVVCFRTGRIVHGVIQTSFDGAQDLSFVIRLAEKMLQRVDETFDGDPAETDPNPDPSGG